MHTLVLANTPRPNGKPLSIGSAVNQFLDELPFMRRKDGKPLSKATQKWYLYELTKLQRLRFEADKVSYKMADVGMLAITEKIMVHWPNTASFGECVRRLYNWHGLPQPRGFCVPKKRRRERTATRSEFARLLRAVPTRSTRWLLWFGWDTMARSHEINQLKWQHVQLDKRCISLEEFKASHLRKDGVTRRLIPLSEMACRILRSWKRRRNPASGDHVFLNWCGNPWRHAAVTLAVRRACKRAGLDPADGGERIVRYSLRHTSIDAFAQSMLAQGTYDITLLADIAGHADVQTTRRYLHRRESQLVEGIDRFRPRRQRAK